MDTIGDRLRALRKHLKLTGDLFGELCGAGKSAVSQWEDNSTRPAVANLIALHEKTGVSIDWVLTGHGPDPTGDQRAQRMYDIFSRLDERGKTSVFRVAETEYHYITQAAVKARRPIATTASLRNSSVWNPALRTMANAGRAQDGKLTTSCRSNAAVPITWPTCNG